MSSSMDEKELRDLMVTLRRALHMITHWIDQWLERHP